MDKDLPVGEALAAHFSHSDRFGVCLRAIWMLIKCDQSHRARALARAFAVHNGATIRGGDALVVFVQQAPVETFNRGAALIFEGTDDSDMFVLLRGRVTVRRLGAGEVAQLSPGESVGEIAAQTGVARTASVYATATVEALRLPAVALKQLATYLPFVNGMLASEGRSRLLPQLMLPDSVLGGLTEPQKQALFDRLVPITVEDGTFVVRQLERSAALCVICSGKAEVWSVEPDGSKSVKTTLGPGDFFGEMSLLYDRKANANVEALTPLTFFALRQNDFKTLLSKVPLLNERFISIARHRMGMTSTDPAAITAEIDAVHPLEFIKTHFNSQTCPNCGYSDAGATCLACGNVL